MSKQIAVCWLWRVILIGSAIAAGILAAAWVILAGSLADLDGERAVAGIVAHVDLYRDDRGVVTIEAADRADVAFALGFVHAQERFFQMDLLRRSAAGELSEIFGSATVGIDRERRRHQFRQRARAIVTRLDRRERQLVEAYARGAAAGLEALGSRPFEYVLLRSKPDPWQPEDCILAGFAMYLDLQGGTGLRDRYHGLMREALPADVYQFLARNGSAWEAILDGRRRPILPIPDSGEFGRATLKSSARSPPDGEVDRPANGSNAWAVGGDLTGETGALFANDMHLNLAVPPIWFAAGWRRPDPETGEPIWIHGLTLPGTPVMITGSNGRVAWGFTNSYADTQDVVLIETVPGTDTYRTPDGVEAFGRETETIRVKGSSDVFETFLTTRWGPLKPDVVGSRQALAWIAYDPGAIDMGLVRMEQVRTVEEALQVARTSGVPAQNMIVGDHLGSVGWTIAGRLPHRHGFDGGAPVSFASGLAGWSGNRVPDTMPSFTPGSDGRVWSANERQVGDDLLPPIGDGGYHTRGRAWEIRRRLQAGSSFTPDDFLDMQLDTRVPLLGRWRDLVLDALDPEALREYPERALIRKSLSNWDGRAEVDSVAYGLIRSYRDIAVHDVLNALLEPVGLVGRNFQNDWLDFEETVYTLVSQRPGGWIEADGDGWRKRVIGWVDQLIDGNDGDDGSLLGFRWGRLNPVQIRHPISKGVPLLSGFLDRAPFEGRGDFFAINALRRSHGPSARMVVPVGAEQNGYLQLPGGQSGHPLSPFYRTGFDDWVEGRPVPFLPGESVHRLRLVPKALPAPAKNQP